ncbi:MAG: methylmalonyl-CoA mutase family protein [Marmoricola sp.]
MSGLDDPKDLEPAQGSLRLANAEQSYDVSDWEASAATVLRKTGRLGEDDPDSAVWDKLTRTTLDGIEVAPLGTASLMAGLPDPGLPGTTPYTRGRKLSRPENGWDVRASYADPDARATAAAVLTDLESGVTSIWLQVGPSGLPVDGLAAALKDVLLDVAPVVLETDGDAIASAEAFVALITEKGVRPAVGTNLGADPIGAAVRRGREIDAAEVDRVVGRVAELATEASTLALVVDGTAVHDLGASDAQELGWTLAVGVAYLRSLVAAGHELAAAAELLEFRYAATDEQFPTIAKLRAARRLWDRVLEACELEGQRPGQRQHVVTSRPMMSKYDPWVNMLRTTVASFAAGVGGADAVTVLPFDAPLGLPDAFSRRIARNTSSLLISESHVAKVTDPAGGSFAVEKLTDDLARAAWAELGAIEAVRFGGHGGVLAALADGSLTGRIEKVATERRAQVAERARPLTGLTEYPNLHETLPGRKPYADGALVVHPYGHAFERLRDEPASGRVFLATMGTVAAHTARATFAGNLFAAGGVDVVTAGRAEGVDDVLAAYDGQPVVCLAGPDKAYAEWGSDLVKALREAGATWLIVAGKPSDLAVDDSCAVGVDALEFLHRTREQLSPHEGARSAPTSVRTPKEIA